MSNWQNSRFNEQQWNSLQALVDDIRDTSSSQDERNEFDFVESTDDDDDETSFWKLEELKFFDSHFSNSYDLESMIRDDKNVYYRNVHLFVERVKNLIVIKNVIMIKQNLNICLRNYALIWYTI